MNLFQIFTFFIVVAAVVYAMYLYVFRNVNKKCEHCRQQEMKSQAQDWITEYDEAEKDPDSESDVSMDSDDDTDSDDAVPEKEEDKEEDS